MKKYIFKITMIISLLLLFSLVLATEVIVNVGDGTTSSFWYPLNFWYRTNISQVIYMQSELNNTFGTITQIGYYNNFSSNLQNTPVQIWMGTTSQNNLSAGWIPTNQLTLVYDDVMNFPSGANDIIIELDTPFEYLQDNLVVMAHRPMDTSWHSSLDHFYYTETANFPNRARNFASDSNMIDPQNITYPGSTHSWVPNTVFYIQIMELDNDLAATSISGNTNPAVGNTSTYTINIINFGFNDQTDYTVKLMKEGDIEIESVPGLPIESGQTLVYELDWTPEDTGPTYIWGEVVLDSDENPSNNTTNPLNVTVNPEFLFHHLIGDGQQSANSLPINFWWGSSLSQSIYMEEDFNNQKGIINSIEYFNQFSTNIPNTPINIWMANTLETQLTDNWIPFSEFELVFQGNLNFPSGSNTILIPLDNDFYYYYGNLVIMVQRPLDNQGYSFNDEFFYTETPQHPDRSRHSQSDWSNQDPTNYPWGNPVNRIPNTGIYFSEFLDIEYDLMALNLDGPMTITAEEETVFYFNVRNTGQVVQEEFSVHLVSDDEILVTVEVNTFLEPYEEMSIEIPWTPTESGLYTVHGVIESDFDEIENNNISPSKNIYVIPSEFHTESLGESDQITNVIPIFYTNRASLSQSVYHEEEFNFTKGTVSGLSFFSNFGTPLSNMPVRIWLKNTYTNNLTGAWLSYDGFEMVFDGHVDFPQGPNPIFIEFDDDFNYTHGNLAVMVQSPYQAETYGGQFFYWLQTPELGFRSRMAQSSVGDLNPEGLPFGSFSMVDGIPHTDFYFSDVFSIENDLAAVTLSGNPYINVDQEAVFNVMIRNMGIAVQDNFDVRLLTDDDLQLALVNVQEEIAYLEEIYVEIPWTPDAEGTFTIYAEVILDGDEVPENDYSNSMIVNVIPQGLTLVTVGDLGSNTSANTLPLNFWWRNSITQSLYFDYELNIGGLITGVTYYNNFNSNLTDMPVKIWASVTENTDFLDGWIPYSDFDLVFDGLVDFPNGQNEIYIEFDEVFFYDSSEGHLVLMAYRPHEDYYSSLDRFFYTETLDNPNRSIIYHSDSIVIDPENPPTGDTMNRVPNTTLHFNTSGFGTVEGFVQDENGQPLADVEVSILGTNHIFTTSSDGYFIFPFVDEGNQTIVAEKFAYYSAEEEVTIIDDDIITVNFELSLLPIISITGNVVPSDNPDINLEGAEISIGGYNEYTSITDSNGVFEISGIYGDQTYNITVIYPGYAEYHNEFSVGVEDYDLGTIIVNEIAYPPVNFTALLEETGEVLLSWEHPNAYFGGYRTRIATERKTPSSKRTTESQMHLRSISNKRQTRILELYTIFRILEGNEDNPDLWTEIATISADNDSYIDSGIIENGHYLYAIKAVYTNNVLSEPIFSNVIEVFMNIDITINLSTNSGDSVTGATVNLINENMNPDHQYSATSPPSGIILFQNIWKGFYTVEVELLGFESYSAENVDLTENNTMYVLELIELILPVLNLEYTIEGNNITLTWDHPYSNNRKSDPFINSQNDYISERNNVRQISEAKISEMNIKRSRVLNGFNVYRIIDEDYVLIAENIDQLTYTDMDLPDGTYQYGVEAVYVTGSEIVLTEEIIISDSDLKTEIPIRTQLYSNFPNPFNPETFISFSVTEKTDVKIEIFNIQGQKVRTLINNNFEPGFYKVKWDSLSDNNTPVGSGIYFYRMTSDDFTEMKKMILLK